MKNSGFDLSEYNLSALERIGNVFEVIEAEAQLEEETVLGIKGDWFKKGSSLSDIKATLKILKHKGVIADFKDEYFGDRLKNVVEHSIMKTDPRKNDLFIITLNQKDALRTLKFFQQSLRGRKTELQESNTEEVVKLTLDKAGNLSRTYGQEVSTYPIKTNSRRHKILLDIINAKKGITLNALVKKYGAPIKNIGNDIAALRRMIKKKIGIDGMRVIEEKPGMGYFIGTNVSIETEDDQ